MNIDSACPPLFWLESACAGDSIPPSVQAHLTACESCSLALRRIRTEYQTFQAAHPPPAFRRKVFARMRPTRKFSDWRAAWVLAPVMIAAVWLGITRPTEGVRLSEITLKGSGGAFEVFYKRDADARPLFPGVHLRRGDALRFAYTAATPGFLMILDVEDGAHAKALYPFGAEVAAAVRPHDDPLLPGGIALDNSPHPEFFVAVFSPRPFTLDSVTSGLSVSRNSPPKVQCPDCRIEIVQIEKEP